MVLTKVTTVTGEGSSCGLVERGVHVELSQQKPRSVTDNSGDSCSTALLLLYYCCTAVLLYYCCTAVLLYCYTAVIPLYCCPCSAGWVLYSMMGISRPRICINMEIFVLGVIAPYMEGPQRPYFHLQMHYCPNISLVKNTRNRLF